jgi:Zinc finger, C2H2 type
MNKAKRASKKSQQNKVKTASDVANFLCNFDSVCDLAFDTIKELLDHVKTHFGANDTLNFEAIVEEPAKIGIYKCDQCDAHYRRSEDLLLHRRVHLGLPLYSCHRCPRKFALSPNLFNHVKNVHSEIIDPERLSEIFDKTEAKKENDSHRYEEVQINGKTFVRKFFCPVCPLVFVKMKTLEIHCRRNHLASEYTDEELAVNRKNEIIIFYLFH